MKMKYEKPLVAVEHYELTQTIAACAAKVGFLNSACVLDDPTATNEMKGLAQIGWFVEGYCDLFTVGGSTEDGLCYHTNANTAFNS